MSKMLQGVSCHPLTPHLIKLIVTCIRLGKKEGKNQTIKWHFFSIHSSSRYLKIMLMLTGTSHDTACEHQLAFPTAVLSQAHSSTNLWNFTFTQSQFVQHLKLLPVGKKSFDPVCLLCCFGSCWSSNQIPGTNEQPCMCFDCHVIDDCRSDERLWEYGGSERHLLEQWGLLRAAPTPVNLLALFFILLLWL